MIPKVTLRIEMEGAESYEQERLAKTLVDVAYLFAGGRFEDENGRIVGVKMVATDESGNVLADFPAGVGRRA
jgi:hypothetical protein